MPTPRTFISTLIAAGSLLAIYFGWAEADAPGFNDDSKAKLSAGEHEAAVNGMKIHYEVHGQGPLLVVQAPAWGIGSTYLRNGLAPLARQFTLLTFDTPGSGNSARPADEVPLSVPALIETLEALRQFWGLESFDLPGHSQGSALAVGYVERYPRRVRKLVLVGSQLYGVPGGAAAQQFHDQRAADPRYKAAVARLDQPSPDTDDGFARYIIEVAPYFFYDPAKDLPAFLQTLTRPLSAWPQHAPEGNPERTPNEPPPEQEVDLANVRARTLIIEGREDPVCPVHISERIHAGIPHSRLLIYERTGHFPWIEQPEKFFADASGFLKR